MSSDAPRCRRGQSAAGAVEKRRWRSSSWSFLPEEEVPRGHAWRPRHFGWRRILPRATHDRNEARFDDMITDLERWGQRTARGEAVPWTAPRLRDAFIL